MVVALVRLGGQSAALVLVGALTGCQGRAAGAAADSGIADNDAAASASSSEPPTKTRCEEVLDCLRAKLPAEYDGSSQLDGPSSGLSACLHATTHENASIAGCMPFQFGVDKRNGWALEVDADCLDNCPGPAAAGVQYAGVSEDECACISGEARYAHPDYYVGCVPVPDRFRYVMRHAGIEARREGVRTQLAIGHARSRSRLAHFQLRPGDVFESVNGKPATDEVILHRLLHRMPEDAPDTIVVRKGPMTTEIHYVSREAMERVEHVIEESHAFEAVPPGNSLPRPGVRLTTIIAGGRKRSWFDPSKIDVPAGSDGGPMRSRSWDSARSDAETRRLEALAARITRAAKQSRHPAPGVSPPFDCRTLGDTLRRVAVIREHRSLELVYADWVDSGMRAAEGYAGETPAPPPLAAAPSARPPRTPALAAKREHTAGRDVGSDPPAPGNGEPSRMVRLPLGYSIDTTEVTRNQYAEWLATAPSLTGQPPSCSPNRDYTPTCQWPPEDKGNHPVVCIDWCDAFAYCRAVGKRLCGRIGGGAVAAPDDKERTKSQWYAACGGDRALLFPYGDV